MEWLDFFYNNIIKLYKQSEALSHAFLHAHWAIRFLQENKTGVHSDLKEGTTPY